MNLRSVEAEYRERGPLRRLVTGKPKFHVRVDLDDTTKVTADGATLDGAWASVVAMTELMTDATLASRHPFSKDRGPVIVPGRPAEDDPL